MPLPAAFPGDERLLARLISSSMSDGSAQADGISHVGRIIHSVRVKIHTVNTSHRILLQEPLRRRIVVSRPVVVAPRLLIELPPRARIRLGHRAEQFENIPLRIIRILGIVPRRQQALSGEIVVVIVLVDKLAVRGELIALIDHRPTRHAIAHRVMGKGLWMQQQWMARAGSATQYTEHFTAK